MTYSVSHGSLPANTLNHVATLKATENAMVTYEQDWLCTVPNFRRDSALEDAIGSHACSLEANMRVTNGIPLGCPQHLTVATVNSDQTLKAPSSMG